LNAISAKEEVHASRREGILKFYKDREIEKYGSALENSRQTERNRNTKVKNPKTNEHPMENGAIAEPVILVCSASGGKTVTPQSVRKETRKETRVIEAEEGLTLLTT